MGDTSEQPNDGMKKVMILIGITAFLAGCGGFGSHARTRNAYQGAGVDSQQASNQQSSNAYSPRVQPPVSLQTPTNAQPARAEAGAGGTGPSSEIEKGSGSSWGRDTGSGYTGRL